METEDNYPAKQGEIIQGYQIIEELGQGNFSTVWQVYQKKKNQTVALKIQRKDSDYLEMAQDEIDILKHIGSGEQHLITLLDSFKYKGHMCLVYPCFEMTLLEHMEKYTDLEDELVGIPLDQVKTLVKDLLRGLDRLHRVHGIIHTDLKLENIMLHQGRAVIVDLGNACWVENHFTEAIQTREYRAPEVMLKCGYDTSTDMWSFGCLVFELITGDYLFNPKTGCAWSRDEDHLAQIQELLGPYPEWMKNPKFFDPEGNFHHIKQLKPWSLSDVLWQKYKIKCDDLRNLLEQVLIIDPSQRATAQQLLGLVL